MAIPRGDDVFLITGAASGIGRHLTSVFSREGARVVAADRTLEALEAARASEGWSSERVLLQALDVRDADAWERAFDAAARRFAPVRVLLNVAGVLRPAWIDAITPDDVSLMLDVNAKGVALGTIAASRHLGEGGHVVNFGSLASLAPVPGLSIYSMSKFAVRGFSLAAAIELAERGIAVTVVMPDAVRTPMLDVQVDREEAALTFSGSRSLGVDEIADAVREVLIDRPIEVSIPGSRGLLSRVAGLFPGLAARTRPMLVRIGRKNQRATRGA